MSRRKHFEAGTASFAGFARLLGERSPSYVTQLKGEGRLVLTDDGQRVRVQESLALVRSTRDPAKAGVVARHAAHRATNGGEGAAVAPVAPPAAAEAATDAAVEADDESPSGGYQHSRAMKERYQAMGAKRDYWLSIGKLMDAGEVEAAIAAAVTTLRTRLESLPDVLGPQLAAINDEAQARATLAEAIEHALDETSRQFYNLARAAT